MNLSDQGGDQFDLDNQPENPNKRRLPLREVRLERLNRKYIVAMPGHKTGRMTFLQDRSVSSGGYWTQFLSNARGFTTEAAARRHAERFRYGNPRVAQVGVGANGTFQYIFLDN